MSTFLVGKNVANPWDFWADFHLQLGGVGWAEKMAEKDFNTGSRAPLTKGERDRKAR